MTTRSLSCASPRCWTALHLIARRTRPDLLRARKCLVASWAICAPPLQLAAFLAQQGGGRQQFERSVLHVVNPRQNRRSATYPPRSLHIRSVSHPHLGGVPHALHPFTAVGHGSSLSPCPRRSTLLTALDPSGLAHHRPRRRAPAAGRAPFASDTSVAPGTARRGSARARAWRHLRAAPTTPRGSSPSRSISNAAASHADMVTK